MKLEAALAITLAFPGGVVVKPRPSKEDQEVIDWARQFVRANALDAIEATRDAWRLNKPGQEGLIDDAIAAHYGERCPDFDPGCSTCKAWKQYDDLTAAAAKLDEALPCEVTVAPATVFGKGVTVSTVVAALDRRRQDGLAYGAAYDEAITRLNRMTDREINEAAGKQQADIRANHRQRQEAHGPAALATAFDEGRLPPVPPPSNLNENNNSTPVPEPFDFEQEGIRLAEEASQWRDDWCDFAAKVHQSLAAAYAHGLRDALAMVEVRAPLFSRLGGVLPSSPLDGCCGAIRSRIAEMEAKA